MDYSKWDSLQCDDDDDDAPLGPPRVTRLEGPARVTIGGTGGAATATLQPPAKQPPAAKRGALDYSKWDSLDVEDDDGDDEEDEDDEEDPHARAYMASRAKPSQALAPAPPPPPSGAETGAVSASASAAPQSHESVLAKLTRNGARREAYLWRQTETDVELSVIVCVGTYVPGPPYCKYGLRVPASCVPYVPNAQGCPGQAPRYVRRTRTGLGRAVRTAYRGTLTLTPNPDPNRGATGLYCTEIAADAISLLLLGTLPVRLYRLEARLEAQQPAQQPAQQLQRQPPSAQHAMPVVPAADAPAAARSHASDADCCVVCLVEPKSHLITPCGHKCVCATCATRVAPAAGRVSTCPICRAKVESVVRVFD